MLQLPIHLWFINHRAVWFYTWWLITGLSLHIKARWQFYGLHTGRRASVLCHNTTELPACLHNSSLWWQSWIESSSLPAGAVAEAWLNAGAEVCCMCVHARRFVVCLCECVLEWMLVLIKHRQLLGPGGGKTSQPLNQDNAFCVTGAGVSCPASPPTPCISSPSLPSHLLTLCQSHSSQAA